MLEPAHGPLAARIPIVISSNPWIMGLGILLAVAIIAYRVWRRQTGY